MKYQILILLLTCSLGAGAAETASDANAAYEQGVALRDSDPTAARQAFERADQQGNSRAAVQLGILYANGDSVPRDDKKAYGFFAKAAAAGQREALYNKGLFLLDGRGGTRHLKEALASLEAAAAAGSVPAHIKLADLYYFGSEGIGKNYALALPHVKAAATAGDAWACNILGTMAEFGHGMKTDLSAARKWFTDAAEQGNAKAQGNLGRLLRSGNPTDMEKVECYKWLKLSSMQGNSMAAYHLAAHSRSMTSAQTAEGEQEISNFSASRKEKTPVVRSQTTP